MALSATQLARIRAWVGAEPTEVILEEQLAALGTEKAVAGAVLRARLAEVGAGNGSVTIESEWSRDPTPAVKALTDLLARLDREADDLSGPLPLAVAEGGSGAPALLQRPGRRR